MIASFRRLSKSKIGTFVLVLFVLAIIASFALVDIQGTLSGNLSLSRNTLASAGSEQIADRDMDRVMQRYLAAVRQENPEADYGDIARDFDPILETLINQGALRAFAEKFGLTLSKRLVDAEIANIPGTRGLDGKFSEAAYQNYLQQERMTDADVRQFISARLLEQLLVNPVASSARVPVGVATPYASMLLEARQGDVAMVPVAAFRAGLNSTDSDLQQYYAANRARYMVPEQRVLRLARIGSEQVANVAASDQEIAAYYRANQAAYAPRDIRVISQAVVPDKATADAIAQRARRGAFAAAAAPAGLSAADLSVGPQTRQQFASLAGEQVAAATFQAQAGAIVGPVQSDLGWHVVKVDSVRREGGKTLEQARSEIAARLNADKRTEALEGLVDQVQNAIDQGANFNEAAAAAKLSISETPLITAGGTSRGDPNYRFPAELAPALKTGFELAADDEPVVDTLPNNAGYVLVAPARIIAAAPAPLASIRAQVAQDWINQRAAERARAVTAAIAAKAAKGIPLAQAVREAGTSMPPVRQIGARRIDLTQLQGQVPAPLQMLFTLGQGKSRMVGDPQGRGFYVVKVNRIVPGNALNQPALIGRIQNEFREPLANEYAQQFVNALRKQVGVRRNEGAIAATKKRITGS